MGNIMLGALLVILGIEYARIRCQTITYVTVACCGDDDDGEADEESAPAGPDGGAALTVGQAMGWAG